MDCLSASNASSVRPCAARNDAITCSGSALLWSHSAALRSSASHSSATSRTSSVVAMSCSASAQHAPPMRSDASSSPCAAWNSMTLMP